MSNELEKYVINAPKLEDEQDYKILSDIDELIIYNKEMKKIKEDYAAKEQRSCLSAAKLVLTN